MTPFTRPEQFCLSVAYFRIGPNAAFKIAFSNSPNLQSHVKFHICK
jgi:hypothetical protein